VEGKKEKIEEAINAVTRPPRSRSGQKLTEKKKVSHRPGKEKKNQPDATK